MKKLDPIAQCRLALFAVILLGILIRLFPASMSGFPINDGGLFFSMAQDLQENHFVLPEETKYNNLGIPFAYPPLGFYLLALVQKLTGISLFLVMLWLPAIVNIITLLTFVHLAKAYFGNSHGNIILATGAYALAPVTVVWLSMGGGITRGLGQLSFILIVASVYKLYTLPDKKTKYVLLSILCGAIIVLSHPAATVHALIAVALLFVMLPNKRKNFFASIWVAVGVGILISPWLTTILSRHGLSPFLNAMKTSETGETFFQFIPFFIFVDEPFLAIITLFSLIGMAAQLTRREYLLSAWVFLAFIISPRGAPRAAIVPMALLASIGIKDILLSGLAQMNSRAHSQDSTNLMASKAVQVFLLVCLGYASLNISFSIFRLSQLRVSTENRAAMEWVKNNTPPGSQFAIMTGEATAMCDFTQEWFPAISERSSATTAQGKEWLGGDQFAFEKGNYYNLQFCAMDPDLSCISENIGNGFNFIFLKKTIETRNCIPLSNPIPTDGFQRALNESLEWTNVYENQDVIIFEQQPQ